ncbi:MAG: type II secretion system protein [Candidatus Saccharibacteria bacterium]
MKKRDLLLSLSLSRKSLTFSFENNQVNKPKKRQGFTIVELLVVIVIIGILAAITIVSYSGISQRATIAALQSDLKSAALQLEIDKTTGSDKYPSTKESANNNQGLKSSQGTALTYIYISYLNTYCLQATNTTNHTTYYVTSSNNNPTSGTCPSIGAGSFVLSWGGSGSEYGTGLVRASDGGYAVTGHTNSYGAGNYDMFLTKYATDGNLSWSKAWGGASGEFTNGLFQTSDAGYVVTGQTNSYGAGNGDMFLVKYATDGSLLWNKTWGGTGSDLGYAIVQTSDGGYAVTGDTASYGAGSDDMFLAKYASDGSLTWNKTWGGTGIDYGNALIQTGDGGYVVMGYTASFGAGGVDTFLAKYASDGSLTWSKTWGGAAFDEGHGLIQTSDGGYAVTGYTSSFGIGSNDMFLAKYASDGSLTWSKTWGGAGTSADYGGGLIQTSDSGYTVVGYTNSFGAGGSDIFLAKYASDGSLTWSKTWGGAGSDNGGWLFQTSDGGYVVSGNTNDYGSGNYDMFLAKYKSDGSITGCSSPMCQSPTASVSSPTATVTSPTATVSTPSATITTPSATTTSPSATSTSIVAPN